MIAEKIRELLLSGIDFPSPDVLSAVEGTVTAAATLASAGDQFDDLFPAGSADEVAHGVLDLAAAFAKVSDPDKNALVKEAFNKVYSAASPDQEAAGEALFASALDFNIAAGKLNQVITDALA